MILKYPDTRLLVKTKKTTVFDDSIIDLMFQTIKDVGVGLSANQIGIDESIIVIAPDIVMVNPTIIHGTMPIKSKEKCLSVEGEYEVPRHMIIRVDYTDRHLENKSGLFEGFLGIVVQHEIDHLNGKLINGYKLG